MDENLEKFQGFIETIDKLSRKFESLNEWDYLTQAEKLKKNLKDFFYDRMRDER